MVIFSGLVTGFGRLIGAVGILGVYAWLTRPGGWASQTGADSEDVRGSGHEPQVTLRAVGPRRVPRGATPHDPSTRNGAA